MILIFLWWQQSVPPFCARDNNGRYRRLCSWRGMARFWFTCEFAQRQRPPDDECRMFDDEGFQLAEGRLRYIRMIGSTEVACRSNKKVNVFLTLRQSALAHRRGKLTLAKISSRCVILAAQVFYFDDKPKYREIWPDKKRCFWLVSAAFILLPIRAR